MAIAGLLTVGLAMPVAVLLVASFVAGGLAAGCHSRLSVPLQPASCALSLDPPVNCGKPFPA
jgi:hypothetical protein